MKLTRVGIASAAITTMLFAATGCGGAAVPEAGGGGQTTDAESVYQEFTALSGAERREKLVEAAEAEGKLSLYTSMSGDVVDAVEEEFEKAFDIEVEVYRAGSSDVLTKVMQEYKAQTAGADVVDTNSLELFALNDRGMLAEYRGERREMVPEEGRFENWTATRFNVFAPSWNTDAVSADEAPKTWEDLADPKWDGRLALELEDYDWYMTLYRYWQEQGKSDEEINRIFADMVDGAEVQRGHTQMAQLHQSGKFDLAASNYTYIVEQKKREGAPLDYLPMAEPAIARANGFGLVKNAGHPAAALLYADWLLEEGQAVMADLGMTTAIVPEGRDDPMAGVEIEYIDDQELMNNSKKWNDAYAELLRSGGGQQ